MICASVKIGSVWIKRISIWIESRDIIALLVETDQRNLTLPQIGERLLVCDTPKGKGAPTQINLGLPDEFIIQSAHIEGSNITIYCPRLCMQNSYHRVIYGTP